MDSPSQVARDFRSAHRDQKRGKDASSKWANGVRPSPGCGFDWATDAITGGSEGQQAKLRPHRKYSEMGFERKPHPNVNKMRARYHVPQGRFRSMLNAWEEIGDQACRVDHIPCSFRHRIPLGDSDDVMYSFDWAEGPNRTLTLEAFVKPSDGVTDRILRDEYEIISGNGEIVVGQKARQTLHRSRNPYQDVVCEEVDGFELV